MGSKHYTASSAWRLQIVAGAALRLFKGENMRYLRRMLSVIPLLFLAVFYFYPLAAMLRLSFFSDAALAPAGAGLSTLVSDAYYARVLWFSAWQAGLSTLLTLALGLPAAYAFARYEFRGKALLRAIATVPFVLPTVVTAAAFLALVGPRGLLNTALQSLLGLPDPPIRFANTLGAVLLAHVFYNYAIVLRIVGGFWSTLDTRVEQAAAVLGARRARVFYEVTLPLLLPAIGAAALLIFVFTFASFGVVLLLGGPTFATVEVEIYRQTAQLLRLDVAAALSLVQMLVTLLLTLLYTRIQARGAVPLELRARAANTRPPGSWRGRVFVGGNIAVLLLLIGAPLLALALRSLLSLTPGEQGSLTLDYYRMLNTNPRGSLFFVPPLLALRNSLLFALAASVLALLVGTPAAYLLGGRPASKPPQFAPDAGAAASAGPGAHLRARPVAGAFAALLDPLFMLPLGASAVTLGLGYIVALGRPPLNLLRSPLIIPVAHALLAFPFVVRSLLPALRGLDPRLREAARVLGASPLRLLREIDLPLLFPALLVGAVFAFTVSLGEFGATLLLSQAAYPTAPVAIGRFLSQPGSANYGQALALSTILMALTALSFIALERIRYRDIGEF